MRRSYAWWIALPVLALPVAPAKAQEPVAQPSGNSPPESTSEVVEFSADEVIYDSNNDIVTANGAVRMSRDGQYLAADQVVWTRKNDEVHAVGNVVVLTPEGDKLVGDNVLLTGNMRSGTVESLLIVLESGGRIAAAKGTRSDGVTTVENAIYSPCPVSTAEGCPRRPSWSITAAKIINDETRNRVRFEGGRLQLFGINLPLLPIFSINRGGEGGASGWTTPDFSVSTRKGFEVAFPYHWQIAPNRDFTVTPHLYTGVWPALEARYRELNEIGAFQLGGFLTYGEIESADSNDTSTRGKGLRAYFEANGKAQLDPLWSVTGAFRIASDKTLTRRYDITRDDRLRNVINVERISPNSYITIAGWAFEGLRASDHQKRIPMALPAIDARFRLDDPVLGGRIELQANSLSVLRLEGQDTQRAFASARWDLRRLTNWGQELTLTGYARADVYHTDDVNSTSVELYRGTEGWHTRGIVAAAADLKWPFIGAAFGGVQKVVPRLQLVLTPPTENIDLPNEDARSIDLEDSNLFALNRFPGYDRWEDASRVTYGVDWSLDRPKLSIFTTIGQSYRIATRSVFPQGTGLTDKFSDIVGRTRIRFGRLIDVTHRFRLDKNNLAVRRNEVDLTVGSEQTYAQVGYLKLNRDIDPTIEDLRDKEELRFAARILIARYWSIFGATVFDLTNTNEDPTSQSDGFSPVRHRLGITYEDECLELGVSWRRDYEQFGTFHQGSTFALRLALKGLGR